MDPLSTLLSWQFVLLCLAISAIIFVFRTIVDYIIKLIGAVVNNNSTLWKFVESLWNDVVLPISPIIIGGLMDWKMINFPYPDNLTNQDFRVIFGIVAGSLSSIVYRMIHATIAKKITDVMGEINKDKVNGK